MIGWFLEAFLDILKRRAHHARAFVRADVYFPCENAELFPNFYEQIVCIALKALHPTHLKVREKNVRSVEWRTNHVSKG